jgi:hypothetical protein
VVFYHDVLFQFSFQLNAGFPPTDGGGLRDFYHNWTNSILQQVKRKFWKIADELFFSNLLNCKASPSVVGRRVFLKKRGSKMTRALKYKSMSSLEQCQRAL